jgi:hypothetical protein
VIEYGIEYGLVNLESPIPALKKPGQMHRLLSRQSAPNITPELRGRVTTAIAATPATAPSPEPIAEENAGALVFPSNIEDIGGYLE